MGKYKDPDSWGYSGVKRRDFQHTHDGPEEMPHKKKKSNKSSRKKARCEHEYEIIEERIWHYRPGYSHKQLIFRCRKCWKKKHELMWVDEQW